MQKNVPVITIDGPGGSGKGTIAHRLARRLGWHCLDSGVLYRIVGVLGMRQGIALDDDAALAAFVSTLNIRFEAEHVWVNSEDMEQAVRSEEAGAAASAVGSLTGLRAALLQRQRDFAQMPGLVADGRDMGTVVFPTALLKFYLTANANERAKRRYKQLINKEHSVSLPAILADIRARDDRDMNRVIAPLCPAENAQIIDSTYMSVEEVFMAVESKVQAYGLDFVFA